MTTGIDLGRPTSGDVIDLITDDHRRFEHLLAQARLATADRDNVRRAFADVLIAHGQAEEEARLLRAATYGRGRGRPRRRARQGGARRGQPGAAGRAGAQGHRHPGLHRCRREG
ncbi:hypothetical protein [Nocardioides convexus]|uniref:hypothetical protein n=1 Tax=Nocardioides convexus TaxID=2712224 RepID=UPI002418374A|nr:hypothetical protein [Nocardioides convexus]